MKDVGLIYEKRLKAFKSLGDKQKMMVNRISNLRLLVFTAGIVSMGILYYFKLHIIMAAIFIAWLSAFIYLVLKHHKLIQNKKYSEVLENINSESLQRLKGNWINFSDTGKEFMDVNHPYTGDLDVFGRGSLFQWINSSCTYTGRQKLAKMLSNPQEHTESIISRQAAINELTLKLSWRQRFMAESRVIQNNISDLNSLYRWSEQVIRSYGNPFVIAFFRILPAVTVILGILFLINDIVPWFIPVTGLVLQFLLLKFKARERGNEFATAEKYKITLKIYEKLLKAFEDESFQSEYLIKLQQKLKNDKDKKTSEQINKLVKLWESISNRYNAYYIFFNVLTLWDYQCMFALVEWKKQSGKNVERWFDTIGQVEALCSFALIGHDHPDWAIPEITADGNVQIKAASMGHPLLGENRVCNDVEITKSKGILLITGSNMSGKSTFLRSTGVNLILAYAGAPVCSSLFQCSIMKIYSCMRTSDNLEQNISSFYAELLRIKMILNSAKEGKQIFFLLDEIFKGTNSRDRHTGAKVLIRELKRLGAVGLVSTHDLELSELEKESDSIINYHFREYYKENNIFFDYKLRPGVSDTRNAIYLMRMAGIEIEDKLFN